VTSPVLIVPGWTNSGPDHWQSLWQRAHPSWRRVEQDDWDRPEPSAWLARLDAAVRTTIEREGAPPVLVGHSLGALLIARWASDHADRADHSAAGALLVAPADVEAADTPPELAPFAPMPRARLPFTSVLVASRNDPYLVWPRAAELASCWGATLYDAGEAGHLNTAAGFGSWPDGERLLAGLVRADATSPP
jgi:predicted alpha/beta hydrolase family esterase